MKRRRLISSDILVDVTTSSPSADILKRLKCNDADDDDDDAAASSSTAAAAEEAPPPPPPPYNYFNQHNKFIEYDWRITFKNLPDKLVEILEETKEPSILNRHDTMPPGAVPYFQFKFGLYPTKKWDDELREFLIENPDSCVITSKKFTMKYRTWLPVPEAEAKTKPPPPLLPTPTNDQRQLIDRIEYAFREPYKNFHIISLQGAAGTGKTFVLSQFKGLVQYITTTNVLCNDVKLKYDVNTKTLCRFLMDTLNLPFKSIVLLQDLVKHVPHNAFENKTCMRNIVDYGFRGNLWKRALRKLKLVSKFVNHRSFKEIYFLDEFSLMSCGIIGLVIEIIRITAMVQNSRIVLIISGDCNQIPPLFIVPTHSFNFIERRADYAFVFNQQMRCLDENYTDILGKILHERDLRSYMQTTFKSIDNAYIEYTYPINLIQTAPLNTIELIEWIHANNIINIANLIFFSFTNRELHFNNISMGVSIWRQLKLYEIKNIKQYVQFQILMSRKFGKDSKFSYNFPLIENEVPHILPLIKFFPYKILCCGVEKLPRSTLVTLIGWNDGKVLVLDTRNNSLHSIGPTEFRMNLQRNVVFRGFPLQLHIGETSYSCQGQTITRGICVNASNATRHELYVTLSRVQSLSKCISIHVP